MLVIAHRCYREGAEMRRENSLTAVNECLRRGWSIEIDLRRTATGEFYFSHDAGPLTSENEATAIVQSIAKNAKVPVAINVKELGYESALIRFLEENKVIEKVFLFDMEFVESRPGLSAKRFRELNPHVGIAARVSDRSEPVERALEISEASFIWLDEFDSLWVDGDTLMQLKQAQKTVYAVSPEIHGFPVSEVQCRWCELRQWGVDGVCTDYPELLEKVLKQESQRFLG